MKPFCSISTQSEEWSFNILKPVTLTGSTSLKKVFMAPLVLWFGFSFTALRAMLLSLLHFPILPLELTLLWGDASLFFFSVCKNQRANSKVKSTLGDKDPMTSNCSTTETYHQSLKVTLIVWQLSKTCVHIRQASKLCRCCPLYPIQQITYDFTLKRHPQALALRNYSPAGRIICGGCGTLRSEV